MENVAEKLFKPTGNYAIMVIRPELFASRQSIVNTLKLLGVEIKLRKTTLMILNIRLTKHYAL